MELKFDKKFEGKLACASKSDMTNLVNFHQSTWNSQNRDEMRSFCPKLKMYEIKIYREFMCHDNEEWRKIWREPDLPFQTDVSNLTNFDPSTHLHFNGLFLFKV